MLSVKDELGFPVYRWHSRMLVAVPGDFFPGWAFARRFIDNGFLDWAEKAGVQASFDTMRADCERLIQIVEGHTAPIFRHLCESWHVVVVGRTGGRRGRIRWVLPDRLVVDDAREGLGHDRETGDQIVDLHVTAGHEWMRHRTPLPVPHGYPDDAVDWWSILARSGTPFENLSNAYARRRALRLRQVDDSLAHLNLDAEGEERPAQSGEVMSSADRQEYLISTMEQILGRDVFGAQEHPDLAAYAEQDRAWHNLRSTIREAVKRRQLVALARPGSQDAEPVALPDFDDEWLQGEDVVRRRPDGRVFYDLRFARPGDFTSHPAAPVVDDKEQRIKEAASAIVAEIGIDRWKGLGRPKQCDRVRQRMFPEGNPPERGYGDDLIADILRGAKL